MNQQPIDQKQQDVRVLANGSAQLGCRSLLEKAASIGDVFFTRVYLVAGVCFPFAAIFERRAGLVLIHFVGAAVYGSALSSVTSAICNANRHSLARIAWGLARVVVFVLATSIWYSFVEVGIDIIRTTTVLNNG